VNDVEVSKGIVVNPHRMSGQPCIKGTRIPALMIANMLAGDQPVPVDMILCDYPSLTYHDIVNAKLWGRRLEDAEARGLELAEKYGWP
jgi:uncharacterized protein (DUF433 family)